MGRRIKNRLGQRLGKLFVLNRVENPSETSAKNAWWNCVCECGTQISLSSSHLRVQKSCGCAKHLEPEKAGLRKLRRRYIRAAKARDREFKLIDAEIYSLVIQNCYYCGIPPNQITRGSWGPGSLTHHGIDRLNNNQGYTLANCVSCCKTCNYAKRKMSVAEFKIWALRLASNFP